MHIGYVALMVLAVAYGVGLAAGGNGTSRLTIIAIAEFVLFPICLLSVLEANNIAILFSPRLLLSLIRKPLGWVLFYATTGGMLVAWIGMLWYVYRLNPLLVVVVNGLLYASMSLIWFRLLGRLGWLITHKRSQKRRRSAVSVPQVPRVTGESAE